MVEFNNGFVTALGLFYGHREQFKDVRDKRDQFPHDQRVYAAADHLFDIEYPEGLASEVRDRVEAFVDWVFAVRLDWDFKWEDGDRIFDSCKDLLKFIDEKVFGLNVEINYP